MAVRRRFSRPKPEFRPDKRELTWIKAMYMTRQQRMRILKWTLYTLVCVALLVVQDVVMSRVTIFGATTDLTACAILLIAVLEGSEVGGIFVLIASTLFYLSGSSPGAFCIASMTFLGIFTALLRQMYWRRNFGSIVLCAGAALMVYEIISLMAGIFMGFTTFSRASVISMTGVLSWAAMVPLYPIVTSIGKIGGEAWKE